MPPFHLPLGRFFCTFLLCTFGYFAAAQCDSFGIVKEGDDGCGIYLQDFSDGNLLEITSANFDLPVGAIVGYSYEAAGSTYACGTLSVIPVNISCITALDEAESSELMCDYAECIHPGDADADLKANVYDLLNIGYGYGTLGPVRPFAHEEWEAQIGPDWADSTPTGINFKHFDSNGDGVINEGDISAVNDNYLPAQEIVYDAYVEGAPELNVAFSADTVVFDYGSPQEVWVDAVISLGTEELPVDDIHGLAFMLEYPHDLVPPHSADAHYTEDGMFGAETEVLWEEKDLHDFSRIDAVVTRKSGVAVAGEGPVFEVSFVIIVDIIIGRAERETPFTVKLSNIEAIDGDGNPLFINGGADATFIILDNTISSVDDPVLEKNTVLSPNPAGTYTEVSIKNANAQTIEIYDTFGKIIATTPAVGENTRLDTSNLPVGLYCVKIVTKEGTVVKKLLID